MMSLREIRGKIVNRDFAGLFSSGNDSNIYPSEVGKVFNVLPIESVIPTFLSFAPKKLIIHNS